MDEIRGFLITGTEITADFLNMVVYYVGKYPEVQRKLREQVNSIILMDDDITYENLRKLAYIDWIMMEVTRYYGPANSNFERIAVEDHYIKDIPISKGTLVVYVSKGSHYNKKYFKNP
jgi:cytochrome P450